MTKDIQKLKKLINENLGKSKTEIQIVFGTPSKKSDDGVWFYRKFHLSPYKDEILFIFDDDVVVDICTNKYFLWREVKSIFYMEGQNPEYKEVSFFN
ncbi:hypothetical protein OF897_15090 [Chryseobacterium formosus]|uniref:Uncharacterized protein n=1 Tax=Chryseobacterium formosus TaxID=1537363 RepID=A0ABT3XUA4_9FLAO|nr:hypothetical protein [Chryseobacterium formosus]MCX8525244.1 hypothetical protein [Chryseobacterium formosus]